MGEAKLKKGWTRVAFGDVVRQVQDTVNADESGLERYVAGEHMDTDDLKIRRWGLVGDGYLGPAFHMRFKPGHVLYGSRRTYLRKVAVADFEGICANTTFVLEPKEPEVLLPELLPFVMTTEAFHNYSIKRSKGSVNPYINFSDLAAYEFALPPLEEQRRIAGVLTAVTDARDRTLALIETVRTTESSVFGHMVASQRPSCAKLGDLLTESPRNGCSASPTSVPTGHWVLALSAITKWGYRRGELKPVGKSEEMKKAVLHKGNLLISRSNTRELVGLPAIFDEERDDISWPDTMMRLSGDESRVSQEYLELFLRSASGRQQVQSYAAGTSASMKKINAPNLKKIEVPLLSLPGQKDVIGKTRRFRNVGLAAERRLASYVVLRRELLDKILSQQEVEVP